MRTFDFMKQFSMFATLAVASGGSDPSHWAAKQVARILVPDR
jgi:hypothetical protein